MWCDAGCGGPGAPRPMSAYHDGARRLRWEATGAVIVLPAR